MRKVLVLIVLLSLAGLAAAQSVGDYCKGTGGVSSPTVGMKDEVSAQYLVVCTFPKETAEVRVKVATQTENSDITIEHDGSSETSRGRAWEKSIRTDASSIKVKVRGEAPSSEGEITALDLSIYVDDGKSVKGYQLFTPLKVTVSKVATGALKEIDNAREKLRDAEDEVASLQAKGADVSKLRSRITDAKALIDSATSLDRAGNSGKAKETARRASDVLDEVLYEARGMSVSKPDYKRYATIAAALVVVLVVALYIKSRREELG